MGGKDNTQTLKKNEITDNVFKLLQYGRHRNVGMTGITRRPQNLNTDVVRLSDSIFVFTMGGKDYKYMKESGLNLDENTVITKYHFLYFDGIDTYEYEPIKI